MFTFSSKVPILGITLGTELQINCVTHVCTKAYSNKEFSHPYFYEFGKV